MIKDTTNSVSLCVRIMLLMICCVLLMPARGQANDKKETESFRLVSFTMAVSGISNPVSQLKTFSDSDGSPLRSPGKRPQNASSGLDGGHAPAALPAAPVLPDFFLCAQEHFEVPACPPESHGLIHWFSLAPPSATNV
ncbi:hypothetical protein [Mailhella sp.]|uniref:hypothetical protein n=1 Tax=Mailhella sp. TaxID=1981029 RepID=UPI003AB1C767